MDIENIEQVWRRIAKEATTWMVQMFKTKDQPELGKHFIASMKEGSNAANKHDWIDFLQILGTEISLTPCEDWDWQVAATNPLKIGIINECAQQLNANPQNDTIYIGWVPQVRGKTKNRLIDRQNTRGQIFYQENTGMLIATCSPEAIPNIVKNYMICKVPVIDYNYDEIMITEIAVFSWHKKNLENYDK